MNATTNGHATATAVAEGPNLVASSDASSSPSPRLPVILSSASAPAYGTSGRRGVDDAQTRAWVTGFHRLTQDYLARLTQLVNAYTRDAPRSPVRKDGFHTGNDYKGNASDSGGGEDGCVDGLPMRLREQGLGGDAQEDAALELDVADLRCTERELLRELQSRQERRQQQLLQSPAFQETGKLADALPSTAAVVGGGSRRLASAGARAASAQRAITSSSTAATTYRGSASRFTSRGSSSGNNNVDAPTAHGRVSATALTRRERASATEVDTTGAVAPAEPPIPPDLLELFRHAQHLTPPSPSGSPLSNSPNSPPVHAKKTDAPVAAAVTPTARLPHASPEKGKDDGDDNDDDAEATALARLCVKYFLTPKPLPAPVTAPPPPPPADRPWSPAERRRSSRPDPLLHGPIGDQVYQRKQRQRQHEWRERRREEKEASPGLIDASSLFPPPNLHPQGSPSQSRQRPRASFSPETTGGSAAEGGSSIITVSPSGPAAWRKLIDKRTATAAAAAADDTPLPSVANPSATTTTIAACTTPAPPQGSQLLVRAENFSFGFPPPRALFAATTASEVLEALSKEEKDGPLSRYLGCRRGPGKPAHHTTSNAPETTQRLPALPLRPSPATPPPPPCSTSASSPSLARVAAAEASSQPADQHRASRSASPQHGVAPVSRVNGGVGGHHHNARHCPTPPAAPQGHAAKVKKTPSIKTHLAPAVVLPPHYHGLHGEQLTTRELEQLVKSVAQESAEAQASVDRTYLAADTAAETLYALQQSVAQVLLENVQLERDIATLTDPASATHVGKADEDAGSAREGPHGGRAVSTAPPALPPAGHARLVPPAPVPSAATATAFTNALFTNTAHSGKLRRTQSNVKKRKGSNGETATPAETKTTAAPPDELDGHCDPLTVLTDLRAATAAREAEQAQTLSEIEDLTCRITRHDALLQAVAEYWRRNAAVMKRQQFAVQSQPKQLSDLAVTWQGTTTADTPNPQWEEPRRSADSSATSASPSESVSCTRSSSSEDESIHCADASATTSSRVPELLGSPEQLAKALAHMEAITPVQPSSVASFDFHHSHAEHYNPQEQGESSQQQQVSARSALEDEQLSGSSVESYTASSPTTALSPAPTGATTRTLFSSPEPPSIDDEKTEVVGATQPDAATLADRDGDGDNGSSRDASVKTDLALAPALKPVVEERVHKSDSAERSRPGPATVEPPATPSPSPMVASAAPCPERHASRTLGSHVNTTTNASRRGEEEEEEVLPVGSWRTIAALQLEKVDEIAEFIYSVFERA